MHGKRYTFKVGEIECIAIQDTLNAYENPVEFLFYNAPQDQLRRALLRHDIDFDGWSEWISPYICLLIKTGSHNVLVDTGMGSIRPPAEGQLLRQLEASGVEANEINTVLITHAHADHSGGNVDSEGNVVFKQARYVMHRAEWDYWTAESTLAQPEHEWMVPVVNENVIPLRDQFDLIDEDVEVVPGVEFIATPGHTPGHMAVRVSSGGDELWYLSDAFLHPIHIEQPDWYASVDVQPEEAAIMRHSLLRQLEAGQHLVHGFHFPFPGLGTIEGNKAGYCWHPLTPGP